MKRLRNTYLSSEKGYDRLRYATQTSTVENISVPVCRMNTIQIFSFELISFQYWLAKSTISPCFWSNYKKSDQARLASRGGPICPVKGNDRYQIIII